MSWDPSLLSRLVDKGENDLVLLLKAQHTARLDVVKALSGHVASLVCSADALIANGHYRIAADMLGKAEAWLEGQRASCDERKRVRELWASPPGDGLREAIQAHGALCEGLHLLLKEGPTALPDAKLYLERAVSATPPKGSLASVVDSVVIRSGLSLAWAALQTHDWRCALRRSTAAADSLVRNKEDGIRLACSHTLRAIALEQEAVAEKDEKKMQHAYKVWEEAETAMRHLASVNDGLPASTDGASAAWPYPKITAQKVACGARLRGFPNIRVTSAMMNTAEVVFKSAVVDDSKSESPLAIMRRSYSRITALLHLQQHPGASFTPVPAIKETSRALREKEGPKKATARSNSQIPRLRPANATRSPSRNRSSSESQQGLGKRPPPNPSKKEWKWDAAEQRKPRRVSRTPNTTLLSPSPIIRSTIRPIPDDLAARLLDKRRSPRSLSSTHSTPQPAKNRSPSAPALPPPPPHNTAEGRHTKQTSKSNGRSSRRSNTVLSIRPHPAPDSHHRSVALTPGSGMAFEALHSALLSVGWRDASTSSKVIQDLGAVDMLLGDKFQVEAVIEGWQSGLARRRRLGREAGFVHHGGALGNGCDPPATRTRPLVVNYYLGSRMLTLKSKMVRVLKEGCTDPFQVTLPTYVLSPGRVDDRKSFRIVWGMNEAKNPTTATTLLVNQMAPSNTWIAKSSHGSKGEGVLISRSYDDIVSFIDSQIEPYPWVVQLYVENPFLINLRKFDIRVWVLLVNGEAWMYRRGVCRTTSHEYTSASKNQLHNHLVHLTNHHIQEKGPRYGRFEEGNEMWFDDFHNYLQ
eukprot:Sspe_Gene.13130::Locus_4504_Transcript_1_1_Confidence_1.000_Length_2486::g.13130::m.13130